MAYIDQEKKKALAPGIQAVLKKYGLKGSIAIRHHMELIVTIRSGALDFLSQRETEQDHLDVFPCEYQIGLAWASPYKECLIELTRAMKADGWRDNTRIEIDYFDISYYVRIKIGSWDKPYIFEGQ